MHKLGAETFIFHVDKKKKKYGGRKKKKKAPVF